MWVARNLSVDAHRAAASSRCGRTRRRRRRSGVAARPVPSCSPSPSPAASPASPARVHVLNQGNVNAVGVPGVHVDRRSWRMVVIGGLGSVEGAVLGAFLVFGLPLLLEFDNPWIVPIGTGILLFVVISRAPGGLAGLLHLPREELVTDLVDLQARATRRRRRCRGAAARPASRSPIEPATRGLRRAFGGREVGRGRHASPSSPARSSGLLGPNGAGKTTTMRMPARPAAADVGHASTSTGRVGYLPEAFAAHDPLTVRGYLRFWLPMKQVDAADVEPVPGGGGRRRTSPAARSAGCRRASASGSGSPRRCSARRRRYVLDEPTIGLDPAPGRRRRARSCAAWPTTRAPPSCCRPTCWPRRRSCATASSSSSGGRSSPTSGPARPPTSRPGSCAPSPKPS